VISKAAIPAFHALLVRRLRDPYFDPHWHYHPEYQLFIVWGGTGTRFVGDGVHRFSRGDLVLTGPNLPHVWRSDDAYFQRDSGLVTDGTVVYFRDVVLRDELLETQEGMKIRQLLTQSVNGLSFHGATRDRVASMMDGLEETEGFERILRLLEILHTLSLSEEREVLSGFSFQTPQHPRDRDRMERVYAYLVSHFTEPVRLARVARIAGMSETAFCRYFRERTNRSFSAFLTELRMTYACKLLVEERMGIARVALSCGYPTLSNFNRQFRAVTGRTPTEYRRWYGELSVSPPDRSVLAVTGRASRF
jgi:AraC-like DNA-binding protein